MQAKKHIIFSFDGGGVRMVLQYQLLRRIIDKFPQILDQVSIIAGTSAGSILAAGLAVGAISFDNNELINKDNIKRIFSSYTLRRKLTSLGGLRHCKYTNGDLKTLLDTHIGDVKFSDLEKKLYITAFCTMPKNEVSYANDDKPSWLKSRVKRWHPIHYTNINTNIDYSVVDAVLESSSAPVYFPRPNGNCDGGIGNNNPSLSVLAEVMSSGIDMKDINILSFGTGERPNRLDCDSNADMGAAEWMPHILDMIFDAEQEVSSQNAYKILGDNFWRLQPVLEHNVDLDDPDAYEYLIKTPDVFNLTHTLEWIEKLLKKIEN